MGYIALLFFLFLVPSMTQLVNDPVPGFTGSVSDSRRFQCERTTTENAQRRYPGQVVEPGPRGDYIDRSAVICAERVMGPGERPPRDDAILSSLERTASGIVANAEALRPELSKHLWLVDSSYPDAAVSAKISFAVKNALVRRRSRVSDRIPPLAVGDIAVVSRMRPSEAYRVACKRYSDEESLGEAEVLIHVLLRDRRETMLHAGLCFKGEWQWIQ